MERSSGIEEAALASSNSSEGPHPAKSPDEYWPSETSTEYLVVVVVVEWLYYSKKNNYC